MIESACNALDLTMSFFFIGSIICGLVICIYLCLDNSISNDTRNRRYDDREIISNEQRQVTYSVPVPNNVIITIVPNGLNPTILQSIPIVDFNSRDFTDAINCVVCLSDLVDGDKSRLLPSCNHWFHVDCIDMWLKSHSTCPICRTRICLANQCKSETDPDRDRSPCTPEVSIESQIPDTVDDAENPNSFN